MSPYTSIILFSFCPPPLMKCPFNRISFINSSFQV